VQRSVMDLLGAAACGVVRCTSTVAKWADLMVLAFRRCSRATVRSAPRSSAGLPGSALCAEPSTAHAGDARSSGRSG
jgi:hypothetical protein